MGIISAMAEEAAASPAERVETLQNMLVARSRGVPQPEDPYRRLRRELMEDAEIGSRLPSFVRTCASLAQFWPFIQGKFPTYRARQDFIWQEFRPLLDYLEGIPAAPVDDHASDTLATFDTEGVHAVWQKALDRRESDPDGAITSARSLLETVCKRILDEAEVTYSEHEKLPKLYAMTAQQLSLAPSQQSEELLRAMLGNCQGVVNSIGELRNKIGDAHGKGSKAATPAPRHAALAVNLAGAMATFLIETWLARRAAG